MEVAGVKIDQKFLMELSKKFQDKINLLEKKN